MAIAYVSGAVTGSGYTSTFSANAPSGIVAGNLLLGVIYGTTTGGWNTPSGWTLIADQLVANKAVGVFTKTATGSEPASYDFSALSGSDYHEMAILQYSGTSGVDTTQFGSGSLSPATAPSVTPSQSGDVWVVAFGLDGTVTASTPTGMTLRGSDTVNPVYFYCFDEGPLASTSPTGTASSTLSGSAGYGSVSVLLQPPGSGITVTAHAAVLPRVPTTPTATAATPIAVAATAATLPRVPTTAAVVLGSPVQAYAAVLPRVPTTATVHLVISATVTPYTETGYAFLQRTRTFRAVPSVTVPLASP